MDLISSVLKNQQNMFLTKVLSKTISITKPWPVFLETSNLHCVLFNDFDFLVYFSLEYNERLGVPK